MSDWTLVAFLAGVLGLIVGVPLMLGWSNERLTFFASCAGHQVPVDVVDCPAHQSAITRNGQQLLGVHMPAVEAHRTV